MRHAVRSVKVWGVLLGMVCLVSGTATFVTPASAGEPGDRTDLDAYDFGDAPDDVNAPGYPTLLIHDGARHLIGGPWFGEPGDLPDGETNGQPDPNAVGDDVGDINDESGITIPPLHSGQMAVVTLDIRGGGGMVQAWIDFDANDVWQAQERIVDGFLPEGRQAIAFMVPETAAAGVTYARFRISSAGGLAPDGPAADGEVEDYAVVIESFFAPNRWCQVADVTQSGIALRCDSNDGNVRWLADDFNSISSDSLSHVRLWGSWKDDRVGTIKSIHLALYANDPAAAEGSEPESECARPALSKPLWQANFDPNQFTQRLYHVVRWSGQWAWDPAGGTLVPAISRGMWQIDIPTSSTTLSGSPEAPVIYWLAVAVQTQSGEFSWNTRQWPYHNLSNAAWDVGAEPAGAWMELHYPETHPYQQLDPNALDMAFYLEFRSYASRVTVGCPAPVTIGCPTPTVGCPVPVTTGCPTPTFGCPTPVTLGCPTPTAGCPAPVTTGCPTPTMGCPAPVTTGCPTPTVGCPIPVTIGCPTPTVGCPVPVTTGCPTPTAGCPAPVTTGCPTPTVGCPAPVTTGCPTPTTGCPPPATVACPRAQQRMPYNQSAATWVIYTLQKDWLIMDWTCPALHVDCPATVPARVTTSSVGKQSQGIRVSQGMSDERTHAGASLLR